MKKPVYIFLAIAPVFFIRLSHAQNTEQKFIEVTVTDTVVLVPDVVMYSISLRSQYSPTEVRIEEDTDDTDYINDMRRKEEEDKMRQEVAEKKLKDLFTKEKVKWEESTSGTMRNGVTYIDMDEYTPEHTYLLSFNSAKELSVFLSKIPKDIKYYGNLIDMRCKNTAVFEDKLLEKIIKRADAQARKIALLSAVKLGSMIQYSDNVNEIAKGIEESIRTLIREDRRRRDMNSFDKLFLTKTVRVRYSIQ